MRNIDWCSEHFHQSTDKTKMSLTFTLSQKGKPLLIHNGYMYGRHAETKTKITWRCVEYSTRFSCSATIQTTSAKRTGSIVGEEAPEHTHAPNRDTINVKKAMLKLKKIAAKSDESSGGIVTRVTSKLEDSVTANMPSTTNLLRTVRRQRRACKPRLRTPDDLQSLNIPEIFTKTIAGDNFLLHDSGGRDRFLIFATTRNLELLVGCQQWAGDGTFKCVPASFQQLYTIHGWFHNRLIPFVYILMSNKTAEAYDAVLSVLRQHEPRLNPFSMMTDFETGMLKAFKASFPRAKIFGCMFHFGQCIWRHVQAAGLQKTYSDDPQFAFCITKLISLTFVPVVDVVRAYDYLLQSHELTQYEVQLAPILDYYESVWIGKPKRNRLRRVAKFSLDLWNCYESVVNDQPRTNNNIEGWHSGFNRRVNSCHVELGKLIDVIQTEQSTSENVIVQYVAGRDISKPRRRQYVQYDQRLKAIVADYSFDHIGDYLTGLAHTVAI